MFLAFKKWVKNIPTAGYNGARTVSNIPKYPFIKKAILGYRFHFEGKKDGCFTAI